MAVLLNTFIYTMYMYDSTCSKTLVPWTVHCMEDERQMLNGYFEMAMARSDETTQAHLNNHKLEEARIGKSKDALDAVSDTGM